MFKHNLSSILIGLGAFTIITSNSALAVRPDAPTIDRDVHMSTQANQSAKPRYTRPTLPTLQTSYDGRIALSHKPEENTSGPDYVGFRLQKPEKFNNVLFKDSANGTFILDRPNASTPVAARLSNALNRVPNLNDLSGSIGGVPNSHMGLCDPSFDEDSSIKNPQACGAGNADDCYDLWVMRFEILQTGSNQRVLHGTRVNVRVENPKTPNASIAEVTITERAKTVRPHTMSASFEPMFPGDGRLLVGRANNPTTIPSYEGEPAMNSDAFYMVNNNPDNFEACDVAQWEGPRRDSSGNVISNTNFLRPLSFAPYDETINTRYGFAMQPFRDGQNNIIPKNIPLGTYPWIDRGADVVSITTIGENLYSGNGVLSAAYGPTGMDLNPRNNPDCPGGNGTITCDPDVQANANAPGAQNGGTLTGRVIMGLWTRGKMVLLDDIINNIDFTLHGNDGAHREVRLYDTGPTFKRIGNGPDNIEQRLPAGNGGNNRFLDSNEHRFNYQPNLRPVTPADVVWHMSSGRGTAEVTFDDYLNPNSFINSNMAQTIRIRTPNGQRDIVEGTVGNSAVGGRFNIQANDNVVLANGTWNIPAQGNLIGDTRVEPIANGGINGKGLWLDGNSAGIEYNIPNQTLNFEDFNWFYGMYVDARGPTNADRALIHFPDGSEIRLGSNNSIRFFNTGGNLVETYTSNEPLNVHNWVHYGFNINYNASNNRTTVTIYLNGYRVNQFTENTPLFQLEENGTLTVGESPRSGDLRGWIDEFKVFAGNITPELACNAAGGTLAGISNAGAAPNHWDTAWANNVDPGAHTEITNILSADNKTTYSEYVCYHDYSDDLAAHLNNIPNGLTGIRDDLLFPEGPLLRDQPRPNSRNNAFCLGCHVADAPTNSGLTFGALTRRAGVLAPNDDRRQPMQPEARVYGNIPNNWLGSGISAFNAGPNGTLIDNIILPSSGGTSTPPPSSGTGPVNLISASATNITFSSNWSNENRVHDGNLNNIATTSSRGTNNGGGLVFVDFNFGSSFTNFTVTMKEDNANPHQVSRWRVQRFQAGNWVNLPDNWETSNNATLKTYPIGNGVASNRLRLQFQAPNGQQVGVQEISITGTAN